VRVRLGLNLGYWAPGEDASRLRLAALAERLGFSVVWVAEAYGSDAVSVLGHLSARTDRIDLGAAVLQIPARAPTMTAMTDALSGGRFRLGLGVSGPQVSEGWYGVRFDDPMGRTREYVEIVRAAWSRGPVEHAGKHWMLPLPDGPGKTLRLMLEPIRERIPLYLASLGPKNLALTGQIADGWLGLFPALDMLPEQIAAIAAGRAQVGLDMTGFDVAPSLPLVVGDDVAACADSTRAFTALYVGGMGSRERNFYRDLAARMGYEAAAAAVQEAYLARRHAAAESALPFEFLDSVALLGTRGRIAERLAAYAAAGVTTLNVMVRHPTVEESEAALYVLAAAAESAGLSAGEPINRPGAVRAPGSK
jgi:F420-dependent oxidoreductase-like protein